MSERTPEQKKNDLENALLQAKRKDIDGIPWYQSEAMADEIERLRDVLANEVKHHVAKIDRIKELEHVLEGAVEERDAHAKQSSHFESLYLMERDKAEAAEDALDKERLRDGI